MNQTYRIAAETTIDDRTERLSKGKVSCLVLFVELFRRLTTDPVDRALRTLIVDGYKAYVDSCGKNTEPLNLFEWIFVRGNQLKTLAETTKKIDKGFIFSMSEMGRFFSLKGISLTVATYCGHLWDIPISIGKSNKAFRTYIKNHLDSKSDAEIAQHLADFHKTTVPDTNSIEDTSDNNAELVGV